MHNKKLNSSYLSYLFYTICLLIFQIIIYELIHESEHLELIWGSINIFLFFLIFLLIYSNHLIHKINIINHHTSHHVLNALFEINPFLKNFSPEDSKIIKKLSREFWQNGLAFNQFFLNKKNQLVQIFSEKENHTKLLHIKSNMIERQLCLELEKRYTHLHHEKLELNQIIENLPIPICEISKKQTITYKNKAFKDKIGSKFLFKENEQFPMETKILFNDKRNTWRIEKTEHNGRTFLTASNISIKDELQKKLEILEQTYISLLDKLDISIAIYQSDTKLSTYNQCYLKTWEVSIKFLNQAPTLGEMIDHLRDNKILPEHHNYETFKKERLDLFKNLLTIKEEILYLPNEKIYRSIILPYPDGALVFIHEDISEIYELKSNLQSLENLTHTVINDIEDFILIFSDNGRVKYFNGLHGEFKLFEKINFNKNIHISEIIKQLKAKKTPPIICDDIYQAAIESLQSLHEFKYKNQTIQIHSKLLPDDSVLNRYHILR